MKKKKFFSKISKLTTAALILTTIISPMNSFHAKAAATSGNKATLRILETTDLHSNVRAYDYYKDTDVNINFGLAKTATLIEQARSQEANSMLFDAGDLIQGNPLADYVAKVHPLGPNDTHPIIRAMNYLHYDAGIVGNHEFNYGLDYLNQVLSKANFPIVNANIYKDDHDNNPDNDQNYFTPYKILDKQIKDASGNTHTIKVGVVGFAPPQILNWDRDNLYGKVIVKDIVETANKYVQEMRNKGADVIVAIAHSGCDIAADGQQDAENAVYSLSKVPGIDALLFGHAHLNFPGGKEFHEGQKLENPDLPGINNSQGTINNTPAVEAGYWGNNLGVLDLTLVEQPDGKWTVDKANSHSVNRPVSADTPEDSVIVKDVQPEHAGTLDYVRGTIGKTTAPLYSYFAQVQDDPTIQIVNNAQKAYVEKWIKDKEPELEGIPVLSAGAPFKAGGRSGPAYYTNIPTGPLSIKSANDLYLYPNTLKAVEVTGAIVREWLEMSAGQFNTVDPNSTQPQNIINDLFPSYNFDVIDGVNYQIDITKPARYKIDGTMVNKDFHRIINLTFNGEPIKDDQKFIVATNNYRAGGGGNFPGLVGGIGKIVVNSPDESRQVLIDYIKNEGTVNPSADHNWSLAPVNKTVQLTFKSSPDAKVYADQSNNIKSLGNVTEGDQTWGLYSLIASDAKVDNPPANNGGSGSTTTPVKPSKLPDTATNMVNYFFLGLLIVAFGATLIIRKRRMQAK